VSFISGQWRIAIFSDDKRTQPEPAIGSVMPLQDGVDSADQQRKYATGVAYFFNHD